MKTWLKNTIALTVLVVGVGGTVVYDKYGSKYLDDSKIYVASHDIQPNQVLMDSDIKQVLVAKDLVAEHAITDPTQIVGKMAAHTMAANQQITEVDLEANPLVPTAGSLIVPIVQNWIYALPDSLRRGDRVDIYLRPIPQTPLPGVSGQPNQPTPKSSSAQDVQDITQSQDVFLTDIPVEFVRNNNNQEVTDAPPITVDGSDLSKRQNGSSNPSKLELLVSTEQWDKIRAATMTNQLIFVYGDNGSNK